MTDETTKHIALKLKQARLQKGMTQAELAKKAGLNTNAYAKIERGVSDPVLATIKKLSKALDLKSSDIFPF